MVSGLDRRASVMPGTRSRPFRRRRGPALLLALALTGAAFAAPTPAHAAPGTPPITVTGDAVATAGQGAAQVRVPVPDGVRPTRLTGTLSFAGQAAGTATVRVAGRDLLTRKGPQSGPVSADLRPSDVADGAVTVSVSYATGTGNAFCPAGDVTDTATLTGVEVAGTGSETAPTSIATFFAADVPAVAVVVPDETGDGAAARSTAEPALALVAAMTHRYPRAAVSVVPAARAADTTAGLPPGSRAVRLQPGDGDAVSRVGTTGTVPTLTLSGGTESLTAAATALGQDRATALASGAEATRLEAALPGTGGLTQDLAGLGAETVRLAGYGQHSQYIGVDQSRFGGPVSAVTVDLTGTHTAVPEGARADLSVYWNDALIDSQRLGDGHDLHVRAEVPASALRSENGLRLQLSATPPGGACTATGTALPMQVSLDPTASTLTGTRGTATAPGFDRFPQALGAELPVVLDDGATTAQNVADGAALIAALQRKTPTQLRVSTVSADDFAGSSTSGLVVGATAATAERLRAPLRLAQFRTIGEPGAGYGASSDAPFAALEAFEHGDRQVLLLGAWSTDDAAGRSRSAALRASLARYPAGQDAGWSALSRNLLVTAPGAEPVLLDSNGIVPQDAVTDDYGVYVWWAAGIVLVLLAAAALGWVRARRRKRRVIAYVDAEQRLDAAEHERVRERSEPDR
ncbi:hypothetical protein GCM10011512_23400 [Tersicoccus solisilvae]|uniref:Cellulose synthase n=1 Tax=Tersicoccus solisilvae TaxID=1882339 RepID=A0ABQ1PEN7_9MICC|nr:cellulose biosynthesis cyclic di-GMP-binding regulatory protein BcsB [Tersicoccus solisilvae]GGC95681.1 hypothetical protein GCM10011512_23400 [Tersicoccus solisilvae]